MDFVADNPGDTLFHCHQQLQPSRRSLLSAASLIPLAGVADMDFGFMALFK